MQKMPFKSKIVLFLLMIIFMIIYSFAFGNSNMAIGLTMVMVTMMNLSNDLSYKPKLSFVKVLALLLIMGVASFLNNPVSVPGCIITFLVVFGTTFTSYHLFSTSIYMPLLMAYFMMMGIPVSIEDLPMRLLSLTFGAVFIVGMNLIVNRKKGYKLTKATLDKLTSEIKNAVDLKLEDKPVDRQSFKTINGFYLTLISRFEYKYFPTQTQTSILNIIKSFQYIGGILADYDFTENELNHIKNALSDISNIKKEELFNGIDVKTKEFYLILLNLEIIINESENWNPAEEDILPDKKLIRQSLKPIFKRQFSFRSAKFTFAFKMALVLTLWEVLTLIFNIPYTKWLYFATLSLMLPYVNDMAYNAKSRLIGTVIGIMAFVLIVIVMQYIPLSQNIMIGLIFVGCLFGMTFEIEDKLKMTIFTTIMSVMISLMYISLPEAVILKILWVGTAVAVVSVINFGFLPYSVEKETSNNLKISRDLNEKSIGLIHDKCQNRDTYNKTTLMVVSNIVRENIEITPQNNELYNLQGQINDVCYFILNYMDVHDFSKETKDRFIRIIENQKTDTSSDIYEEVMVNSLAIVVKLFNREKELMRGIK